MHNLCTFDLKPNTTWRVNIKKVHSRNYVRLSGNDPKMCLYYSDLGCKDFVGSKNCEKSADLNLKFRVGKNM